jgi:hypothetical protein
VKLTGSYTYSGVTSGLTTVDDGTVELGPNAQSPVLSGGGADVQGVNGHLVLDYTGADPATQVGGLLASSYDAGAWDVGQFRCSTENFADGLGWMDDGAGHITIARTLRGDANLDGTVDGSDLTLLAQNWKKSGTTWAQGDFNYDGTVDGSDLTLLARNASCP